MEVPTHAKVPHPVRSRRYHEQGCCCFGALGTWPLVRRKSSPGQSGRQGRKEKLPVQILVRLSDRPDFRGRLSLFPANAARVQRLAQHLVRSTAHYEGGVRRAPRWLARLR